MPGRILSLIEPTIITGLNTAFLIIEPNILSLILFVLGAVWQVSRIKRDIEKYHEGKFIAWWKWLIKKKQN